MSNFNVKKLAIVSLFSVASLLLIPFNATAQTISVSTLTQLQTVIAADMTARDSEFVINYTGSTSNFSADLSNSLKVAEDSNDYLKFSLSSLSCGASGADGDLNIDVKATYLTTAQQEDYVNTAVTRALASIITPSMTDSQKEKAIHAWILKTVSYDYTLVNHSAYAALVAPHKTVCQGYALLMYKMLTQAGITTRIVSGTLHGEAHAWNKVNIGGSWYNVDATNDDGVNTTRFYNVTDSVLRQNGFMWG
ncbi:MAG: transglutaminase domain-containing protein [Desulfosporosinus sp.]|nr:transglutaminase domain-containing protein [Desulfosporosinus sp.]